MPCTGLPCRAGHVILILITRRESPKIQFCVLRSCIKLVPHGGCALESGHKAGSTSAFAGWSMPAV